MPRIRLTGYIDVPEPRRAAIAEALAKHVRLTRAEPACLSFKVLADPDVPGRYNVAELFANRAGFEAHQARIAASDWGRVSAGIARHYEIDEVPA